CAAHDCTVHMTSYSREVSLNAERAGQTDLFFLDIELAAGSGLHAAQTIRTYNPHVPIVFLTNHQKYVFDGYTVQAFRYLMKPITPKDCASCLEQACAFAQTKQQQMLRVIQKGQWWFLPIRQILYIEATGHICRIQTEQEPIDYRKSFREIRQELPPHTFIQTHRSYLVNYRHIHTLSDKSLCLDNGEQIPVSRSYRPAVIQFLATYLGGTL
ncbi:MAG: LytTR family DNA-binding domain-containing protein, partial [Butyricicoccus sp.]|nr:LytTR family DNA-binding domain-containing protein [Butyricicoccus sp.]